MKATPITLFLYHLYDKKGCLMEDEENNIKVAEALLDFQEDDNSQEGERDGDHTDTGSTQAEPEAEPLPEPAPARSHSKSRSQGTTTHHAEPSTA